MKSFISGILSCHFSCLGLTRSQLCESLGLSLSSSPCALAWKNSQDIKMGKPRAHIFFCLIGIVVLYYLISNALKTIVHLWGLGHVHFSCRRLYLVLFIPFWAAVEVYCYSLTFIISRIVSLFPLFFLLCKYFSASILMIMQLISIAFKFNLIALNFPFGYNFSFLIFKN